MNFISVGLQKNFSFSDNNHRIRLKIMIDSIFRDPCVKQEDLTSNQLESKVKEYPWYDRWLNGYI